MQTGFRRFKTRPLASSHRRMRGGGFSLVELLTVMFIIALLIAILIPSLNSARNSAKKTSTAATLRTLKIGLDLFRNENERDFPQTNGYPPSWAHPPIPGTSFDPFMGQFPFGLAPDFNTNKAPVINGAHWLPAMLMGPDQQGYIARGSVPERKGLRAEPWKWYNANPLNEGKALERRALYIDTGTRTLPTEKLPGRPDTTLFPDWADMQKMPVIVDAFDQPVLYYAANRNGSTSNIVADERDPNNRYSGGTQENGPPFYVHQDNHGFTGDESMPGWDFGGGAHAIQFAGEKLDAVILSQPIDPANFNAADQATIPTFARFILDRKLQRDLEERRISGQTIDPKTPLRVSNADSYLLISAGVDGRYGTTDDVTNFPLSAD